MTSIAALPPKSLSSLPNSTQLIAPLTPFTTLTPTRRSIHQLHYSCPQFSVSLQTPTYSSPPLLAFRDFRITCTQRLLQIYQVQNSRKEEFLCFELWATHSLKHLSWVLNCPSKLSPRISSLWTLPIQGALGTSRCHSTCHGTTVLILRVTIICSIMASDYKRTR